MRAEEYQEKEETLSGWPVKVISYRLGQTYYVTVHNLQPGAWITKQEGNNLEETLNAARTKAAEYLAKTRKLTVSTD